MSLRNDENIRPIVVATDGEDEINRRVVFLELIKWDIGLKTIPIFSLNGLRGFDLNPIKRVVIVFDNKNVVSCIYFRRCDVPSAHEELGHDVQLSRFTDV